jgi:diadenosine tetraphosphate (Ap4A) HIT family hydrolase
MTDSGHDVEGCLACDLTSGRQELPGGRIFASEHWAVEHCIGPLGVGALIVKPIRHCLGVADLTADETAELGPLLQHTTSMIEQIVQPDQVYVCLWSHAGWTPGHIHFVLQPSWDKLSEKHEKPGPFLQVDLFRRGGPPPRDEVEAFSERARQLLAEAPAVTSRA